MIAFAVLSGFGLAFFAPWLAKRSPTNAGKGLAFLPFLLTIYFFLLLSQTTLGTVETFSLPWAPQLGLFFSFRADGLGLLFALLISGIGCLVTLYGSGYLHGHADLGRFYLWLFIFMAAMLGVVLADNLILLFIFWELTSLSSFILIGFKHDEQRSRDAALQALLVTGLGGLIMLAGFILIGETGGTYEISNLLSNIEPIRSSRLYLPALILVLIGAFTKSAQFPFHFWLPNAMEAPTPVSAYLHSATMVKAGIYLLARLNPVLGGTQAWQSIVGLIGAATLLTGAYLALSQTDLKRLLAYSTIAALGTMTMLIGFGDSLAIKAALAYLFAHALYKGALFMVAGAIDHEAGTRDIRLLGGLSHKMPFTAAAAAFAALSMAGIPPLFGFISKEILYEWALLTGPWITALMVFGALSNIFVAGLVAINPFWRRNPAEKPAQRPVHEAPTGMVLGPILLSAIGLGAGLFAGFSGHYLAPAISTSAGQTVTVKLALWHGLTPALGLSLVTILIGAALYILHRPVQRLFEKLQQFPGPERLYKESLKGLIAFAAKITNVLQSGYLRYYLTIIILSVVSGVSATLLMKGGWHWPEKVLQLRFYEVGLVIIVIVAAINAIFSYSRLSAVASMGAIGFCIALLYLLYGAPDLAMTQFLIESLTVILFVVAFYHLPHFSNISSRKTKIRDLIISVFVGSLMTLLVLSSLGGQLFSPISKYYAENAYTLAHGRNVVNVILVDFRGMDTLGEITVLSIAAIGVFALLKLRSGKEKSGGKS
jgi:multicomponent Na+:H+ antiporter subunit A